MKRALAVDGGNSKTDLAIVTDEGELVGFARGPASSPHHVGIEGTVEIVAGLIEEALRHPPGGRFADTAALLMAGVDFPAEEDQLRAAIEARDWAADIVVDNDTFAVLRAGTDRGWGIAVVCGAGINCVGVSADGRHARFPALGATTGDWGGGFDVGLAATYAAARSEDGRGPRTSLEQAVPAYFGVDNPRTLAEEIHRGTIPMGRLEELPPVVFAAARDDAVAAEIVDRLASEVVALSRVALERLDLTDQPVELLLGGGLLQAGDGRLLERIEEEMRKVSPAIAVRRSSSPPIVGAVLLALDALGSTAEAQARAREQVGRAAGGAERVSVG